MESWLTTIKAVRLRARLVLSLAAFVAAVASAQERSGEAIFKDDCARCHGAAGAGTKKSPQPLVGEKGPGQLAAVIGRTMPDDDPGSIGDSDSKKVAAYLHDAFYSQDARARINPPQVELSRLTVRQYKNSVADLIGTFGKAAKSDARQGLRGEYFDGRGFEGRKPLVERIDPEVRFNFGTSAPDGTPPLTPPSNAPPPGLVGPPVPAYLQKDPAEQKKFNAKQFCIVWSGSVFAPETGTYDFTVHSEHAVQLWVNDLNINRPLVDARVRSGGDAQTLSGSLPLLAGRSYSIRLEFCKAKELDRKGLDNPKKPSLPASVALLWKTPHGHEDPIPATYLSPARAPELLVLATPFPLDDRSYGWERGTSVSKEWNAATTDAALEAAGFVAARLPALAGVALDAPDAKTKLRAFARLFVERAFRRPLTPVEQAQFVDKQFDAASDLEVAIKRVVLLALKSPRFLYPGVMPEDAYAVASRLSFALWDAPPDQALLDAAAAHKLSTREELAAQAERMLNTPRARTKLHEFLLTWLRVERLADLNKDAKRFPGFDATVAADLRTSLESFLDDIVWSDASDFRQLLLSDDTFMNARLAQFYGVESPASSGFAKVKWETRQRAGVLTHPYMLAGLAYPGESSPIHRGVFVVRGLLGITLLPPPEAVVPLAPDLHPKLTTRERVTLQTKPEACIRCHCVINPLGFALENFDAVGRFRDKENAKPIDVTGQFETRSGEIATFRGARQLAALMAGNEQVHAAFAQQLFQHMLKQPVRAYGLTMPRKLQESFARSNFSVRKLAVEIAVVGAQAAKAP